MYDVSPAVVGQNPDAPSNDEAATKQKLARQPLITKRSIKPMEHQDGTKHNYLESLDDEPAWPIWAEPMIRAKLIIIKVELGVGDKKILVDAIIDSGSEINIVSQNIVHELNKIYPVTPLEQIRCLDANGNQGTLHGRPWIQGNLVSMDERPEGTHSVHSNPNRPKEYTELLVVDEKWENGGQDMANTCFTSTKDIEFEGAWKINEGEEIVKLGPLVMYWTFLAITKSQNETTIGKLNSKATKLENTPEVKVNQEEKRQGSAENPQTCPKLAR
ncbi:hypothetical protein ARMGADRAFT_1029422 [Armillaria gallica]|uniref:Uncharacterized protein n=1 Tax=Armillaria gallica TaxID=47427 RepID=A0A2H3DGC6_ARMGA|nr:hypothetical protein ARMGADRAFT_1029422 [Armillaria gallica]